MKPYHWAMVWISMMLLAIGLLNPKALEHFTERVVMAFMNIAIVAFTFGMLYVGFRMMIRGRK